MPKIPSSVKSPAPSDIAIGRNVRAHRLARGLSQSEIARALGVSYQQVQKYEGGVNRISSGRLTRIAEVLDVPLALLFEGIDSAGQGHPACLHLTADPEPLRLVQAFARVQDRDARNVIVGLVELMARERGTAEP